MACPKPEFMFDADFTALASRVRSGDVDVVIVDSLQTLHVGFARPTYAIQTSMSLEVVDLSNRYGTAFFIVSQVNKDGRASGPMAVEHNSDVVLTMERGNNGEAIISAPVKNRQQLAGASRCVLQKTPKGPIEILESFTGHLPRHGDNRMKLGVTAFPTTVGRETTVDEITITKASNKDDDLLIQGAPQGMAKFLSGALSTKYSGMNTPYVVRGNRSDRLDRAADVAIAMGILSMHRNVVLPVDVAYFGSLDAQCQLVAVADMFGRTERALAQGYTMVLGPRLTGPGKATWTECDDLESVIKAVGIPSI